MNHNVLQKLVNVRDILLDPAHRSPSSSKMGLSDQIPMTTIMMILLFGTNALLFAVFQYLKSFAKANGEEVTHKKDKKEKELSKPFIGTVECFTNLTHELFRCGLIMALTYICEKHWFFPHSGKEYSRDLFMFVLIIFFAYAFYTIKPIHDLSLLGREQTEEWKGWMQFIFLLYHYFHAEEVYNSVRVMITCYVWMTGFGNFSFFYMKQDFGWLRVMQMLWRLNFSVLLLMWTHGNTYILYYICPMHTFYFLMVYAAMYVFSGINHTKWGIRWKLMILGVIIYIIWDINNGIFDFVFSFLGTDSVVGASRGSVWEYYFRTSLDHWSSFLGMIFALNFPLAEQFFTRANAKGWPLVLSSVLMGALAIWWFFKFYTQEKLEYNLTHSYTAIIPLTAYIFFRNITPTVRSAVSMSLHDLGKTTLETYLLQHHIWLTSNAKTLLTLTPGHPWINFALATILFFTVSKELYRLTMTLRGMVMPEDKNIAWVNSIGTGLILLVLYVLAALLQGFDASALEIAMACVGLLLVVILLINRFARSTAEHFNYQQVSNRAVALGCVFLALGTLFLLFTSKSAATPATATINAPLGKNAPFRGNTKSCLNSVSSGFWTSVPCPAPPAPAVNKFAYCQTDQWRWVAAADCPVANLGTTRARTIFKGKRVMFIGDSVIRNVYHEFNHMLEPKYLNNGSASLKHTDLAYKHAFANNTVVSFVWAPMVPNITTVVSSAASKKIADVFVAGSAAWDALYIRDLKVYTSDLNNLATIIPVKNGTVSPSNFIWIQPTIIVDAHLPTADKQKYMAEAVIKQYRSAYLASKSASLSTIIDPTMASVGRDSVDGVHYSDDVYGVIAQMVGNAYTLHFPSLYAKTAKVSTPKPTGSMSFPSYGLYVLIISAIMLFSMDSFFGFGFISLKVFGSSLDWESAYGPLHKKIGVVPASRQLKGDDAEEALIGGEEGEAVRRVGSGTGVERQQV